MSDAWAAVLIYGGGFALWAAFIVWWAWLGSNR